MRWVRAVYVVGFADGTCAHLRDLVTRQFHAYSYAPWPVAIFFYALVLLDPLAAVLVIRRHIAAPLLAVAIMAADLAANYWLNWPQLTSGLSAWLTSFGGPLATAAFGVFVFVTAVPLYRDSAGAAVSKQEGIDGR
jgi:hypothetical protein